MRKRTYSAADLLQQPLKITSRSHWGRQFPSDRSKQGISLRSCRAKRPRQCQTATASTSVTRLDIFGKKLIQAQRIRHALSVFYPEIELDFPTRYCP